MKGTEWLNNAVIYHIFIDRFAGFASTEKAHEAAFMGGTIKGVTEKLPYIESLGVTAIWISPFYKGNSYHGYRTTDFYKVDEHFGDEADLKELVDEVHKRGMKIICDFVPNHVSNLHPYFVDAQKNRDSRYRGWFIFDKWPRKYRRFLSVNTLPKLNLNHKPAMDHVSGAARKWMELGFDGFRLDHIIGLSNQNVRDLVEPLRTDFPGSVYIGEAWFMGSKFREIKTLGIPNRYSMWWLWRLGGKANELLYQNYVGLLDGILNFEGARLLEKYANARTGWGRDRKKRALLRTSDAKHSGLKHVTFLDNHDMDRFLFRCKNRVNRLMWAARLQFSLKQPVVIYYGTEIGMTQQRSKDSRKQNGDLYCRQPMEWSPKTQDTVLLTFYKQLIRERLRKQLPPTR